MSTTVRYMLVSHGFRFIQAVAVVAGLSFTLTGSRIAAIDRYGPRADIVASVLVTIVIIGLLSAINRHAKSLIDRRFYREQYDARQILTALFETTHTSSTTQQVIDVAIHKISDALHPESATVFLKEEDKNEYVIASSSATLTPGELARSARVVSDGALDTENASIVIPIAVDHQQNGFIALGDRLSGLPYAREDKLLLDVVATQIATFIEDQKLIKRRAEEQRKARELEMAAEVQRHLFPSAGLNNDDFEVYGICLPAQGIGGDYYDYFPTGAQRTAIAVADVAGKGIAAALLMSTLQASLRCQISSSRNALPEIVSCINHSLQRSTSECSYATFFLAEFDSATRELTYVNAGHNPPMLFRCGVSIGPAVKLLSVGGPIIGAFANQRYEQDTVLLKSGDVLIVYTDGVTEALNAAGIEFGEERLRSIITSTKPFSAREAAERVITNVLEWQESTSQHDDITLVVLVLK